MSKPRREGHELKPEQEAGFRKTYSPSSRENPQVRVGNSDRQPLIRTDMREAIRLTGQWRHEGNRYHVFINHAGPHIEMLLALVCNGKTGDKKDIPRDKARSEERLLALAGDADASERTIYKLYVSNPDDPLCDTDVCGTLKIASSNGKRITLDLDFAKLSLPAKLRENLNACAGGSTDALRLATEPSLFKRHLLHSWVQPEVRSRMWFPPTAKQIARQEGFILGARITADPESYLLNTGNPKVFGLIDLIRAYHFTISNEAIVDDARTWRFTNIIKALDSLVQEAYHDALNLPAAAGGIDELQVELWRTSTLKTLVTTTIVLEDWYPNPTSLLTIIQAIIDGPGATSIPQFEKLLFIQRHLGGHYYAAEIDLVDMDGASGDAAKLLATVFKKTAKKVASQLADRLKRRIPVGVFLGLLTVRKQDDPEQNPNADNEPPEWEGHYMVELAGLEYSLSAGTGGVVIHSSGSAKNVYGQVWQPEQLHGPSVLLDVGISIFGGGTGKGGSFTFLICYGSGENKPRVPLQINFSGLADLFSPGAGAAISASGYGGALLFVDAYARGEDLEAPPVDEPFDYGSKTNSAPLHFPINGAGLEPDAERLLQVFAGQELALLHKPGVVLRLDGYADQPHSKIHNLILSRNRAITVFNYLKNILEDDLAIKDLDDVPSEEEEIRESKKMKPGQEYKVVIPDSKQVFITPHGEPAPDPNEEGAPKYDQHFRRVDMSVDGVISLRLKRNEDT